MTGLPVFYFSKSGIVACELKKTGFGENKLKQTI